MKDYSQNGEQRIILEYFRDKEYGILLDIGANDGITLSNSRALLEMEWDGFLIEPSPSIFPILERNCEELNTNAYAFNCAIATQTGRMTLYESDSHLVKGNNNNLALLSSLVPSEIIRWGDSQKFEPKEVDCFTWEDFMKNNPEWYFDFITIDAEGMDWEILKQIDLSNTQMVCIEWNQNKEISKKISNYCHKFGFKLLHRNYENLIFAK